MPDTDHAPRENRRKFTRVPCNATALVRAGELTWRGQLVDISMKGVLVELDAEHGLAARANVEINILLASETPRIRMVGTCAHVRDAHVGIRWERMDLESFWHLRRLIELNGGAGKDSEAELAKLLDPVQSAACG